MVAIGGAAVAAVGSIAGGLFSSGAQSSAATKARRSQETQFVQQMNEERQRWNETQARTAPWVGAGVNALYNMEAMNREGAMGWQARPGLDPSQYAWSPQPYAFNAPGTVDPNQYRFDTSGYNRQVGAPVQAGDYRFGADPYTYRPGQALDPNQFQAFNAPTLDPNQFQFKAPSLTDDPGYQFRLRQGVNALDASAAARGSLSSGAAQKALVGYGQDLGSQEYGAAYGRALGENQMGYGRALQQNQDIYGRGWAADQANYGRALTANMTQDERARAAAAQNYQQQFGANQFNFNAAMAAQQNAGNLTQQQFGRDYQAASDYYNRLFQQQQTGFTQGLAANELAYNRDWGAHQFTYQRDQFANQQGYDRDLQAYQLEQARRQQQWNQYASLAGLGQVGTGQLAQAGAQYGSNMAGAYQGLGTAQAAGAINQANATTGMWQGISGGLNNAASQYMQYNMMQNLMNSQQRTPTYTGDAPGM